VSDVENRSTVHQRPLSPLLMWSQRATHSCHLQAQEQGFVDQVTDEDDAWIQRLCAALLHRALCCWHLLRPSSPQMHLFVSHTSLHYCCDGCCCCCCRYKEQEEAARLKVLAEEDGSDCEGDGSGGPEHLIIDDDGVEAEPVEDSQSKSAVGQESA
jgi:hypothetical protein